MTLTELFPKLRELSRIDKLRLVHFLVDELALEGITRSHESGEQVEMLRNSHAAAQQLTQLLEEQKQVHNA